MKFGKSQRGPAKLVLALLTCLIFAWPAALAEEATVVANKVKAAMLLNFIKYVEWPAASFPSRQTPLVIGIIGKDSIVGEIEKTLTGMSVERRTLIVRQFGDASEARECHVVFICASEKKRIAKGLENLKKQPILTVSDVEGFIADGGMIGFRREANTIKFDINHAAAEKAGLKISSKLLQLGRAGQGSANPTK